MEQVAQTNAKLGVRSQMALSFLPIGRTTLTAGAVLTIIQRLFGHRAVVRSWELSVTSSWRTPLARYGGPVQESGFQPAAIADIPGSGLFTRLREHRQRGTPGPWL